MVSEVEKYYFLPKKLGFVLENESAAGIQATATIMEKDGFKIPGYLISGNSERLAVFLEKAPAWNGLNDILLKMEGKSGLVVCDEVRVDGKECFLLSLIPLVVHDLMDCGSQLSFMRVLQADITKTLEDFSKWIGQGVLVASPKTRCMRPKATSKFLGINIVIDASPPGDAPKLMHKKLCGLELSDDKMVVHAGPARGQGTLVRDDDGEIVAQIIDDSLYIFVPLFASCQRTLMDSEGLGLFKRVLRLAWNASLETSIVHEEKPIENAESYQEYLDECLERQSSVQSALVAKIAEKIAQLEEEQMRLLGEKRQALMLLRQCEVAHKEVDRGRWEMDWTHLASLAGVQKVSVVDGGIHVETESLVATHDGVKYRLGSFIIRYCDGGIYIWPQNPAHERGRAHPHISEVGTTCFGNIGIAVRSAAMEARVPDAVELVLRWLTEGYDPELADTRIEEWPREEELSS